MKHCKLPLYALALSGLLLTACKDDSPEYPAVDGQSPVLTLTKEIKAAPGETFRITGTVSDADGISTISLDCPGLWLKKTIDIVEIYEEPLDEYALDYKVKVDDTETADSFTVTVTATDVLGNRTSDTVTVNVN